MRPATGGERTEADLVFPVGELTDYFQELPGGLVTPRQLQRLVRLAYYDDLTGLPNRVLLRDRVSQALERSRRSGDGGGLLYIDVDNFKSVNDSFGHGVGDEVLKKVAARIKSCVRPQDTPSRIGGDEFVVLVADVKEDGRAIRSVLQGIGARILAECGRPASLGPAEISVGLSIGAAMYPEDACTFEELLYCADSAMYRAKKKGGRVEFCRAR